MKLPTLPHADIITKRKIAEIGIERRNWDKEEKIADETIL